MDFKTAISTSLLIHFLLGFGLFWKFKGREENEAMIRLQWNKGQIPNLSFFLPKQKGEGESETANQALAGTPEAEIQRFQNEIHFPPEAVEQRLESDCTWELEIGPGGIARKIRTVKPCKYPLFEAHFRKSVSSWKFQLPEGKIIIIPVSFSIESYD